MKSVVFRDNKGLVVEDIPAPEPGPKQIQLKVHACGICGSDIHYIPNAIDGMVFGHEFAGEVVAVGSEVTKWKIGDRVVPMATTSCGVCKNCVKGDSFNCLKAKAIGFHPRRNGAYAEYVVVGERDAIALPDNVSYDVAATVEPLAVGYDAVRRADLKESEAVLIVGAGPIGLCIALWARFFGAKHVVVAEKAAGRLAVAKAMGATATIDAGKEDTLEAFRAIAGGRPTVIFEATGAPGLFQMCVNWSRPTGKIVVAGICPKPDSVNLMNCVHKRLNVMFSFGYSLQDFDDIVTFLGQERIDVSPMILHRISLDEVPATFDAMMKPGEHVKVIIQPAA